LKRPAPAVLVLSLFLIDRALKSLVFRRWAVGESHPVLPGFLHFTRVNNDGAAFGLLKGSTPILAAVSAACAFVLARLLIVRPETPPLKATAFSLVLAGALGNLYDRVRYGYVLDFIDLRVWPVFNVADACITAGAALLVVSAMAGGRR
jgi:signal peptidase II